MAIGTISFVHGNVADSVSRIMAVVTGVVGSPQDKAFGHMVRGDVIKKVSGMVSVTGAASIWHPGAEHRSLAVTAGRSL